MTWDDEKEDFETRPNIGANNKLPADEWNAHVNDQKDHSTRHEDGGSDELDVSGLSGVLADAQTPQTEAVEDIVGALLTGGTNISLTYDDAGDVLTIDTSALDGEEVEDRINDTLVAGSQVTTTYDDAAGTLTITIDAPAQTDFDNHSARHANGGADEISVEGLSGSLADAQEPITHASEHENNGSDELNVSGLSGVLADAQTPQTEAVEDIVAALLAAGDKVGLTYDDSNGTLTIDTSALDEEEVEDAVAALVTAGNAITVNYDDANDALSIAVDESALSFYDGTNLTADVDNDSVNTGGLTVDGQPSDNHEELIAFLDEDAENPSVSFSADSSEYSRYRIEILDFDGSGASQVVPVELTIEGVGAGNYNYRRENTDDGTEEQITAADFYGLVDFPSSGSNRAVADFILQFDSAFSHGVYGIGAASRNTGSLDHLVNSYNAKNNEIDPTVTIQAQAPAGESVKVVIAVFEERKRDQI
jgi:hypothetical protein